MDKKILESTANSLLYLINKYNETNTTDQEKKWYKSLIVIGCRHVEFFITPHVSTKAAQKANEIGIGDISNMGWGHQKTTMKDPERSTFHLEHVKPVSQTVDTLLALERPSLKNIKKIICTIEIAWILKSEDKILDDLGFKSCRPTNAWDAYKKAKIRIKGRKWADFGL